MSRNEAQTRFDLIDPAIISRGWDRVDIQLEVTAAAVDIVEHRGRKEGRRRPVGRSDYVLRRPLTLGTEPIPLAIIEAKREGLPPEHGLQQGKGYRVGHLHAVPFVFSSNGHQFVRHPQKNAKVAIATFQTLDQSSPHTPCADDGTRSVPPTDADPTFFQKNYPPNYFDVIIIDECHRSAWGDWFTVLDSNKAAIQVGLTATPRQIRLPEADDADLKAQIERDRKLMADNLKYFGEATYEYSYLQGVADGYLAPADLETYDLFHDDHLTPERKRGVKESDLQSKRLSDAITGQRLPSTAAKDFSPAALDAKLILPERVDAMCRHLFEQLLQTSVNESVPCAEFGTRSVPAAKR